MFNTSRYCVAVSAKPAFSYIVFIPNQTASQSYVYPLRNIYQCTAGKARLNNGA